MAFSVTFNEMQGYPRGRWVNGEFDGQRRVMGLQSDLYTYLTELDTYPNFLWPYTSAGDPCVGPASATAKEARTFTFPRSASTATGGVLQSYNWSIVDILYTTRGPQWDTALGVHIEETLDPASRYELVSRKNLRWKTDGSVLNPNDEPHHDMTLYEYVVRYSRLLTLPTWVLTRPGVCNANEVAGKVLPLLFAPKTLRYTGCAIRAKWTVGTTLRYDVAAHFLFHEPGWDTYWRPDGGAGSGGWDQLVTKDGDDYIQHPPVTINVNPSL